MRLCNRVRQCSLRLQRTQDIIEMARANDSEVCRDLYLELLKKSLTGTLFAPEPDADTSNPSAFALVELVEGWWTWPAWAAFWGLVRMFAEGLFLVNRSVRGLFRVGCREGEWVRPRRRAGG